jgi:hypothetical protein
MSNFDIPDQAMDVAWRVFSRSYDTNDQELCTALADAITAAAPLIVATELRRQAESADARASDASYESTEEVTEALLNEARHLRARANELDPPGGAA